MTPNPAFRTFTRDDRGSTSVEFVVVFFYFIAIFFFVVQVALYMFFSASLEKAAEAGVRAAVVSPQVVTNQIVQTPRAFGGAIGVACSDASDPCGPLPTRSCSGADCRVVPFDRIFDHMQGFNGRIQPGNVTITYSDAGIGFAGGPAVPMVTVTVSCVPFDAGIFALLDIFDPGGAPDGDCRNRLGFLPPRSASMTGEDLAL